MLDILLQLSFLFLMIMFVKNIMDMKKYNSESQVVELNGIGNGLGNGLGNDTDNEIENDKKIMDPLLIKYKFDTIDLQKYIVENPLKHYCMGDICLRLSDYNTLNDIYIYKNDILCNDLNLKYKSNQIIEKFQNMYSFNAKSYCSLLKGNIDITIDKNNNNICLIGCLDGSCKIYLYNPKHSNLLKDDNIKKYGIQIDLIKDKLLYIPSEWQYSIHTKEKCALLHLQCDTYFTSLYNEYRV